MSLQTSGDLTITTGGEPALTMTAGQDVIDRLTSEVRDGVLVTRTPGAAIRGSGPITHSGGATVTSRVTGSGDLIER